MNLRVGKIKCAHTQTHSEEESNPMLVCKRANKGGTDVPKIEKKVWWLGACSRPTLKKGQIWNLNSHQLWEIHVKLTWESNKLFWQWVTWVYEKANNCERKVQKEEEERPARLKTRKGDLGKK